MAKARLLALLSVATLLAACSGGGVQSIPQVQPNPPASPLDDERELSTLSTFTARAASTGNTVHVFPTVEVLQAARASNPGLRATESTSGALVYWGGPIQTAPKVYVVYWGSSWNSRSGDPSGVKARLNAFLPAIGGSSWLNSVTQYTQTNPSGHVGNAGNISGGSWVDTGSSPPRHPSDAALQNEALRAAAHFGDYSVNASYVVATPHGHNASGFGTQYCAYHSITTSRSLAYTNLPYMPDAGASCGANSVNGNGKLDGVSIVEGHEQAETETDPQAGNGWLDSTQSSENGDLCAWVDLQNTGFGSHGTFPTQPLYSNASASCVQHYP